jgi:hypothetical protein
MDKLTRKSGGYHDKKIFDEVGDYKKKQLIGLCNLLDKKGIDYDTRILRRLSRGDIQSLVYELRGKKFKPTETQLKSFESRGVMIDERS